jgi:low affinity Fe/Cu permease
VPDRQAPPAGADTRDRQRWLGREPRPDEAGPRDRIWPPSALRHAAGWEERHWTSRVLHRVGDAAAHSGAGIIAAGVVMAWVVVGVFEGFPAWWQTTLYSVSGSVTFVMVFVIQHTQERQTAATQRKLDELIRSSVDADDTLIAVEEASDERLHALADLNLADREQAARAAARE